MSAMGGNSAREVPQQAASPPSGALGLRVTRVPGAAIVALTGNVDVYTVPELRRRLDVEDISGLDLVVDVSEVHLIDSAGLGALVSLRNGVVHAGGRCGVATGRQAPLFAIAGLTGALACGPDVAVVLADLRARAGGSAREAPVGEPPRDRGGERGARWSGR